MRRRLRGRLLFDSTRISRPRSRLETRARAGKSTVKVTGHPKNLKSEAIVEWNAPVHFQDAKLQHAILREKAFRNSEDSNINISVKALESRQRPRPRNSVDFTGGGKFRPEGFIQIHHRVANHNIYFFFARLGQQEEKLECYTLRANRNVNDFCKIHTCAAQV